MRARPRSEFADLADSIRAVELMPPVRQLRPKYRVLLAVSVATGSGTLLLGDSRWQVGRCHRARGLAARQLEDQAPAAPT